MNMKKWFLVSLIMGTMPLTMTAQDDDMYFVPKKQSVERKAVTNSTPRSTYYSGSNRNVDEYNRRGGGSYYEVVPTDTTGNDIIDFSGGVGVYPDSAMQEQEDFNLTREMSRWDGYEPDVAFMAGYNAGRVDSWHSPWYYSSYYPWYDSYWYWNDPWYYRRYGWYSTWYDPWYYDYYYGYSPYWYGGYYSYYHPYYYGPHYYIGGGGGYHNRTHYDRGMVASTKRGVSNGRTTSHSAGTFGGAAINNRNTATRNSTYSRNNTQTTVNNRTVTTNSHGTFAGNRTLGTSTTTSSSSSSANRSTGSFGGSSMSRSTSSGSSGSFGGGGGGGVTTRGGSRSSRR